ncbi:carbon-nitrogen hydrolase [Phaffia rhodozyma]|uniref:Carbon-nitrogen hydrolase n=1 Tax=Phaffia rhodozyma TaxID=264483 RepID=A0A0F7SW05_PHARH|nr:carbon-nitrogen hydrolase [Phaffia rhodozyma]
MASIKASPFRLSLIQLGGTGANKQANLAHAKEMVLKAAKAGGGIKNHLVVLPEVFNSPYAVPVFRKYAERIPKIGSINSALTTEKTAEGGESVSMLSAVAKEAGVWLIGGSIPEIDPETDSVYNTCTVYDPSGELVAIHRKVHLFDIDIPGKMTFKESDSLTGGRDITSFETPFGKIGLGICYDIRFPEMAAIAARQGCVALIYPAAFNMTTGPLHWELLQRARAVDNQVFVSMCSPARSSDLSAYQAWGHTSVYDPMGLQLATTDEKESIVHALIDPEVLITARKGIPVTVQRRFDVYKDVSA